MLPLAALGVGAGALLARAGLRAARRAGVGAGLGAAVPAGAAAAAARLRAATGGGGRSLAGFDAKMSAAEAYKILNLPPGGRSKEAILAAHRNLMLRNHPDNGGSNFVASKVNEAKELLLGQ